MQVTQPQREEAAPWSWRFAWRFHGEGEVKAALEEYTAFIEAPGVGKYGEFLLGGDESDGSTHTCKMRIRAEIDACMDALQYPWFHRLLDLYYRRGLSCENKGWCIVAKRLGLRGNPASRWDRDTFETQVTLAISRLWRVHEDRYQRKS